MSVQAITSSLNISVIHSRLQSFSFILHQFVVGVIETCTDDETTY